MKIYGLIGFPLSHSFSAGYFKKKFEKENIKDSEYRNFEIPSIDKLPEIIKANPNLIGLNVTIPYKEQVLPYLDELDEAAKEIGAVNTIRFTKNGKLKGYNTDYYGFQKALNPLLQSNHKKALILGTGGASKAVAYALNQLGIKFKYVSRTSTGNSIVYSHINSATFEEYKIIINCTPLGTSQNTNECPEIPYQYFTSDHIAFDLIYNPAETLFLQQAKEQGAIVKNGIEMLVFQAEKAWGIWNK